MQFLHKQIFEFNTFAATNELKKLAPTIRGRIEQANKWFLNPYNANSLSGIQAARFIIGECQRLALSQFKDLDEREFFLKQAYESEMLMNSLASLKKVESVQTIDLNIISIGKQLHQNFKFLTSTIKKALIRQVADDFMDITYPIKKLSDAVLSQPGKQG